MQAVSTRVSFPGGWPEVGPHFQGKDLTGANLTSANLTGANLYGANLTGAVLDGVIGADFTGAINVPKKYLKD